MKNKSKRLICIEEYAQINGINQYLFHLGTKYENPVLLYLHGGPGSAESLFAHLFQEKLEEIYTVVHWDQRGTGKTLTKNPDKYPTIDLMTDDLFDVIQYLKKKYKKEKISLIGHSWGSVLGSIFIKKYPEEVAYYIGFAQLVSMRENLTIAYKKLEESINQANDKKSFKRLKLIGDYPGEKIVLNNELLKKCSKVLKLQKKYNLADRHDWAVFFQALKSPIFKISDISAYLKGLKANKKVLEELAEYDLTSEPADYKVPIYYISGGDDWQVPYVIAQKYFEQINAPRKKFFLIPNAGHMLMVDQPKLFCDTLLEIYSAEK